MTRQSVLLKVLLTGILLLWLLVSFPFVYWFIRYLPLHFDLFHGLIAVIILVICFRNWTFKSINFRPERIQVLAVMCCIVGIIGLWLVKSYTSIRILGFCSAMLILYGVMSLLIDEIRWRKGLFPFLLLLMSLPFDRHMDIFIGYPLRMFLVDAVGHTVIPFFPDITSNSGMLVMENRASFVDMDCSGLRGLWVSLLIYFLLSWLEPVRNKIRWLLGLILFMVWIIAGNYIRILLLVLIHSVFNLPLLDPLVHHSISLIFLLSGCYFAFLWMKNQVGENRTSQIHLPLIHSTLPLSVLILSMVIVFSLPSFGTNRIQNTDLNQSLLKHFVEDAWTKLELSRMELEVFNREGVTAYKLEKEGTELILVLNGDWRSQHKPELCYESSGFRISRNSIHPIRAGFLVRSLEFEDSEQSAWYWFQQGKKSTSDFGEKVWAQLSNSQQTWTMVSVMHSNKQIPDARINEIFSLIESYSNDESY